MSPKPKDTQPYPKLKSIVVLVTTTAVVVSGIWAFFHIRICDLKDERISLLESEKADLQKSSPTSLDIKRLEEKLIPLTLAIQLNPLNGRVKFGSGLEGASQITELIIGADEMRKAKKYDLAQAKLDQIDELHPDFPGTLYFRFLIEKDKENRKQALVFAEQVIDALPDNNNILDAYDFAVRTNVEIGEKKKAEEQCLRAIRLDPENRDRVDYFKAAFKYEPTLSDGKDQ